jgi:plasmid stabilization system protein ParE
MRRLLWRASARSDLAKLVDYFADKDPRVADMLLDRIEDTAKALRARDTGRPGRMPKLREKSVARTKYILAYRALPKQIIILRVIHAAQNWTASDWPESI